MRLKDNKFDPSQVVGSECKDGRQVLIVATVAPGDLLHRGDESKTGEVWDVITVEATTTSGSSQTVTVLVGGEEVSDRIPKSLTPGGGAEIVCMKRRIKRGLPITAFASTTNVVNVYVEVGVLEDVETV